MEKNHIIGFILIFATLLVFNLMTAPSKEELAERKRIQDSIAVAEENLINPEGTTFDSGAQLTDTLTSQEGKLDSTYIPETTSILENDVIRIEFSSKGGFIKKATLKNYKNSYHPTRELEREEMPFVELMADPNNSFNSSIQLGNGTTVSTSQLNFTGQKSGNDLAMIAQLPNGGQLAYKYSLNEDYRLKFSMSTNGFTTSGPVALTWSNYLPKLERGDFYEQRMSSVYFKLSDEDDPDYCSCTSDDVEEMESDNIAWVSHSNQFFNTTLSARSKAFSGGRQLTEMIDLDKTSPNLKRVQSDLTLDFVGAPNFDMEMYIGPNDFKALQAFDTELEQIIPYGSSIFGSINRWIVRPFFNFLAQFVGSKGVVILLLIFIIKMALYPLLYKMLYSQAKMGALKPELAHLKDKFKDEPQKIQMESMKIYQEYGVSPLSGCLPMLLQMPIWIALYRFFPANINFRQESFLWANDLSSYDSFFNLPFEIPFMGSHLSLFTLLWAVSTLIYTYYNSRHMDLSANPAMKYVQYLMPLMFLGFFNTYASGLTAYMFFSNLINIIQIIITKNFVFDDDKIRAELMAQKAKPKKKSAFQQRLEEAMKQQQKVQAQKKKK